jgi:riboflavin transporter FmnP
MKKQFTVKKMIICALFIALSVIGAFIKPFGGSIAFDSMPAFLAASLLGPFFGSIVGLVGHLVSASLSGFPLSIGIHIIVAVEMAIVMFVYGFIAKKANIIIAAIVGVILNGVAATAVFILIPNMGIPFFLAMVGPLTLVSAINVALAVIVHLALKKSKIDNVG